MYKFSSLSSALTSPLAWGSLVFGMSIFTASPAFAEAKVATPTQAAVTKTETKAAAKSETKKAAPPTAEQGAEPKKTANPEEAGTGATAPAPKEPTAEEREQARVAFESGSKLFAEEKYEEALASFKKAYELIPSPHAEYWIALSMDKADPETKDAKALAGAYETFLTNPGAAHVGDEEVAAAQTRLGELRKGLPATVTIVTEPEGASVAINGEAKEGKTPLTVELPAGAYQVGLTLDGYDPATVEISAEGGIALEQQVKLAETVVAPPPPAEPAIETQPEPEAQKKSMVPAYVTLGLGGAGLVSGTVFGIMALNSKSKFKDEPTVDNADAAERNALIADMSFGIALTLGLTGIVLLTSEDATASESAKKKQGSKTEFTWAPYASPIGGGAAARLTF